MFFGERAMNFRQRGGNLVGFGRQNQNAGEFRDFGVGRNRFRTDFGSEMFTRGVHRVAGDDFAGAGEFAANEAAGERGGHFARAEKADFQWGCHESFVAGHLVERKKITPVNSQLEFAPLTLILGAGQKRPPRFVFYAMSNNRRTWDTFEAMRQAAEEGDPQAQCYLGVCFQNGQGVAQDFQEAVKWYRRAAEQDDPVAQCYLAVCYLHGTGVPQELGEAAKWLREAAEQSDPAAQFNLGMLYETGQGVPQNYVEAVKWYREAAERGYPAAQFNLGVFYETGQVVPQDYVEAAKWYRAAAEQECAPAQCNLGLCYQTGRGVEQNRREAVKWFIRAARQGDKTAQHNLGLHYAEMEIREAEAAEAAKNQPH